MANPYYTEGFTAVDGNLASVAALNTEFTAIETGFGTLDTQTGKLIRFTEAQAEITDLAAARPQKLLGWDSSGDPELQAGLGDFKGDWAGSTAYVVRDMVLGAGDAEYDMSPFICLTAHTSTASFPTDYETSGYWAPFLPEVQSKLTLGTGTAWTTNVVTAPGSYQHRKFEIKTAGTHYLKWGSAILCDVSSGNVVLVMPNAQQQSGSPTIGYPISVVHYKGTLTASTNDIEIAFAEFPNLFYPDYNVEGAVEYSRYWAGPSSGAHKGYAAYSHQRYRWSGWGDTGWIVLEDYSR